MKSRSPDEFRRETLAGKRLLWSAAKKSPIPQYYSQSSSLPCVSCGKLLPFDEVTCCSTITRTRAESLSGGGEPGLRSLSTRHSHHVDPPLEPGGVLESRSKTYPSLFKASVQCNVPYTLSCELASTATSGNQSRAVQGPFCRPRSNS